jgi:hypothetical protein
MAFNPAINLWFILPLFASLCTKAANFLDYVIIQLFIAFCLFLCSVYSFFCCLPAEAQNHDRSDSWKVEFDDVQWMNAKKKQTEKILTLMHFIACNLQRAQFLMHFNQHHKMCISIATQLGDNCIMKNC